ncbi:nitrogen regulation protein [gamma proteobacterium HTCC5015]|nr:nitrogen regulation protein [gamma proteobacterium HTCC5015]
MAQQNDIVWIIDDDQSIRWVLERAVGQAGYRYNTFKRADEALAEIAKGHQPSVVLCDVRMPGTDGMSFLSQLQADQAHIPIIIMTAHSDLDSAVSAYEGGAFEYLPKPFDIDEATALIERACEHRRDEMSDSSEDEVELDVMPEIIGEAPAMQEVFRAIGRLSRSNITVLINGESGTGKELVAQALHRHSPRADGPFIALNMAAIPRDLLESELFGHEKGAFTGANTQRKGRFEQANSGTLFLDEIGDMPAELQTRLLRVLADGEFYRVGGTTPVKVNVRIVAATHQNLENLVQEGAFREDLFHRLNVIRVHLPALRERREDIPLLMEFFLSRSAKELDTEVKTLSEPVKQWLSSQNWPGNVRQLENLSRWLTVMASSKEVQMSDLPSEMIQAEPVQETGKTWQEGLRHWAKQCLLRGDSSLLDVAGPEFERQLIEVTLEHTKGRRQDAAKLLGWGRNTLTRKIKELDMEA